MINSSNKNPASKREKKASQQMGIRKMLKPVRKKISFLVSEIIDEDKGLRRIIPNINKALKILEPNTFATAKSDSPFREDKTETAHSGAEVPIPSKTTPIKKAETPSFSAKTQEAFTKSLAPNTKETRPIARKKRKKIKYTSSLKKTLK